MHFINRSDAGRVGLAIVALSSAIGLGAAKSGAAARVAGAVVLVGHGWGPGVGMGQWGDFGYAVSYHEDYSEILGHFYPGTVLSSLSAVDESPEPTVRVLITENMNTQTNAGFDPVVTASSAFTVSSTAPSSSSGGGTGGSGGATGPSAVGASGPGGASGNSGVNGLSGASGASGATAPTGATGAVGTSGGPTGVGTPGSPMLSVPGGSAVDLRLQPDGTWNAYLGASCGAALGARTPSAVGLLDPVANPPNASPTAPRPQLLTLCRHDGVDETVRGSLQAYDRSGYERTLNVVSLDSYLEGVVPAEESASWGEDGGSVGSPQGEPWGFQALEAQAVAARSYTLAYAAAGGWQGYADVCDSQNCEAYAGANFESAVSDAAVLDTTGQVLLNAAAPHAITAAYFSASSGGWTAPSAFPAVVDLGDACVEPSNPLECNPNHSWRVMIPAATVARHYPRLGRLVTMRVTKRNRVGALGGRADVVLLRGTRTSLRVGGGAFADALGLRSNWFAVSRVLSEGSSAAAPTGVPPAVGAGGPHGASGAAAG